MANRNYDTGYTVGKRLIEISGSFVPLTGAGTVVASTVRGLGFGYAPGNGGVVTLLSNSVLTNKGLTGTLGIVRNSAGLYTITLEDAYQAVNDFTCDLAAPNTGSALWAQPVEPVSNFGSATAAPTIQILIVNSSGTPTDAAANMRMYFDLILRDSTVQFNKP